MKLTRNQLRNLIKEQAAGSIAGATERDIVGAVTGAIATVSPEIAALTELYPLAKTAALHIASKWNEYKEKELDLTQLIIEAGLTDALTLHDSMKGAGTDEDTIWRILNKRRSLGTVEKLDQEFKLVLSVLAKAGELPGSGRKDFDLDVWLDKDGMHDEASWLRQHLGYEVSASGEDQTKEDLEAMWREDDPSKSWHLEENKLTRKRLRKRILEVISDDSIPQIQAMVDGNQYLKGMTVAPGDLLEAGPYIIYASQEGLKHVRDRHLDPNAPGSLFNPDIDLAEVMVEVAQLPPTSKGHPFMVKWEGVKSPVGQIGHLGLAAAAPEEVAAMKSYTMPGGRNEIVKVAPGERMPTDEMTLVTAKLGALDDGRQVLSLVTMYPGGMTIDGVTIPMDRNAFAAAGIYFVLPPTSPILMNEARKKRLAQIINEEIDRALGSR